MGCRCPVWKPRKKVVTGATLQPTAQTKNDVWSWDFVHDVPTAGEPFGRLTVKDEATCFCLAIEVDRSLSYQRVIAALKRLLVLYGRPRYVRSDNGPELMAQPLLTFFKDQGITPSRITPGKSWQNGSYESFNGTFRRECLDAECFHSLTEGQVVIEDWRCQYNQDRPHSTLDYHSPASAYSGPFSRGSDARCLSAPAGKNRRTQLAMARQSSSDPTQSLGRSQPACAENKK